MVLVAEFQQREKFASTLDLEVSAHLGKFLGRLDFREGLVLGSLVDHKLTIMRDALLTLLYVERNK